MQWALTAVYFGLPGTSVSLLLASSGCASVGN